MTFDNMKHILKRIFISDSGSVTNPIKEEPVLRVKHFTTDIGVVNTEHMEIGNLMEIDMEEKTILRV